VLYREGEKVTYTLYTLVPWVYISPEILHLHYIWSEVQETL